VLFVPFFALHVPDYHKIELKILHLKAWGKRLLQLVRLVRVGNPQCVQVTAAADFELGHIAGLLDFDRLCVLATCRQQEFLNFRDLLRLRWNRKFKGGVCC
jgi:hypothetical protein